MIKTFVAELYTDTCLLTVEMSRNSHGIWWGRRGINRNLESMAREIERSAEVPPEDFLLWQCCECGGWDRSVDHTWVRRRRFGGYYCDQGCGHQMCVDCLIWVPYRIAVTLDQREAQARQQERIADRNLRISLEQTVAHSTDRAQLERSGVLDQLREVSQREEQRDEQATEEEDEAVISTIPRRRGT